VPHSESKKGLKGLGINLGKQRGEVRGKDLGTFKRKQRPFRGSQVGKRLAIQKKLGME